MPLIIPKAIIKKDITVVLVNKLIVQQQRFSIRYVIDLMQREALGKLRKFPIVMIAMTEVKYGLPMKHWLTEIQFELFLSFRPCVIFGIIH